MDSPLNKTRKELTLFLIEKSYEVYKQNFVGSKAFETPIPRYRDNNPPLESLPPGTNFFSRDLVPPPPPPPLPPVESEETQFKKRYNSIEEYEKENLLPPAKKGYRWELDYNETGAIQVLLPPEDPPVQTSKEVVLKPINTSKETLKKKKAFFDFNPEKAQRQELAKQQSLLLSVETQKKKENIESAIETIEVEIAEPIVNEKNVYNLLNYLNEEFSKLNLFPKAFVENISSEIPSERKLILPEEKEKVVENISLAKKEFILSEENFVDLLTAKINQFENQEELFELEENEFLRNDLANYKLFNDKELYSLTILLYSLNDELSLSTLKNVLQINSYYYLKEEKAENLFFLSEIVIKEEELLSGIKYKPIILKDNTNNKEINLSLLIQEYITDLLKSDFKILRQANIENNLSDDEKKEAIKTILDEVVEVGKKEAALNIATVSEDINIINLTKERIVAIVEEGTLWSGEKITFRLKENVIKYEEDYEGNLIPLGSFYELESKYLRTEKDFNWCGAFIAFCYKDFIKKEIRRKVMISTYRFYMFAQKTKRHIKIQPLISETLKKVNNEILKIKNIEILTIEEKEEKINKIILEGKNTLQPLFYKGAILILNPNEKYWYGTHFAILTDGIINYRYTDNYDYETTSEEGTLNYYVNTVEGNTYVNQEIDATGVQEKFRYLKYAVAIYKFLPEDYNLEFQGKVEKEYSNAEIIIKDPLI
jgi:hypothetical protein